MKAKILGFTIEIEYKGFDFIETYRVKRAVRYWNEHIDYIKKDIEAHKEEQYYDFKWYQLVWQEIKMYCCLQKQVTPRELNDLSVTRGFSKEQFDFLIKALKHVGLGKKLEGVNGNRS